MTNVTYNAITTDFWGNLVPSRARNHWKMFGLGGDAKGQPTQTRASRTARRGADARSWSAERSNRNREPRSTSSPRQTISSRGLGASAGVLLYRAISFADLIAHAPRPRACESKFKGLADIALGEAKRGGCSYADIRFTMTHASRARRSTQRGRRRRG